MGRKKNELAPLYPLLIHKYSESTQLSRSKMWPKRVESDPMVRMNSPLCFSSLSINRGGGDAMGRNKYELAPLYPLSIHKYLEFTQLSKSKMWVRRGGSDPMVRKIIKKEENRRVFSVSKGKF
jgi:hypothetical protein